MRTTAIISLANWWWRPTFKGMKKANLILMAALIGLGLTGGCNKQEPTAASPPPPPPKGAPALSDSASQSAADLQKNADKTAADMKKTADQATADMKKAADQAAADVQAKSAAVQKDADKAVADTQAQAGAVQAQNDTIIERIKKLLADNKPADALQELKNLAGQKLTPEQQARVTQLTQQAQAALQQAASKATDKANEALGGLLNNKK